jgi:mevalonate kinase
LKTTFYSNGKLLITGEYTVLDGATALALPTRHGQYLHLEEYTEPVIKWESRDADGAIWFKDELPFSAIIAKEEYKSPETNTLVAILHEAHKLNPDILQNAKGFKVETKLTFPRQWGLGTSSTLINNVAQWFSIDAFDLLNKSFGGSGYDIACAQNDSPITYRLKNDIPVVEPVIFNPAFSEKLWFVYLNQKQNSRSAIAAYRNRQSDTGSILAEINELTAEILETETLPPFCQLIEKHEAVMGRVLELPTVKKALFSDFNGMLKSLGAWGGDFILAAAEDNPTPYFNAHGYYTVIPYSDMILK